MCMRMTRVILMGKAGAFDRARVQDGVQGLGPVTRDQDDVVVLKAVHDLSPFCGDVEPTTRRTSVLEEGTEESLTASRGMKDSAISHPSGEGLSHLDGRKSHGYEESLPSHRTTSS
jgi:hypothetical protein